MSDEVFDSMLGLAAIANASDVFLAANEKVYWRVYGRIQSVDDFWPDNNDMMRLYQRLTVQEERKSFEERKKADFFFQLGDWRYRIHLYMKAGAPAMIIRIIPLIIPGLNELGQAVMAKQFIEYREGLLLITGPTGSGKSTTAAALLNCLNLEQQYHILTLEDPIEFLLPHGRSLATQLQLGKDFLSYSDGVKNAMRESPDVIYVSEIRDTDTALAVLSAAVSGHFIIATMHTSSGAETIERLVSMHPSRQQDMAKSMLSACLRGICCQRLIPGRDGTRYCAMEVLRGNNAVSNIIRTGRYEQLSSVIQSGFKEGMQTIAMSKDKLKRQGLVS